MKTIFAYDPWRLVENELHKDDMRLSESMTSIWRASGSRIKRAWAGGKTATRSISARSSTR